MKRLIIAIVGITSFAFANAESADKKTFSYDYVQGFYSSGSANTTSAGNVIGLDVTGFQGGISKSVTDNIYITASYGSVSANSIKVNSISYAVKSDVQVSSVGIGYRLPLSETVDLNIAIDASSGTTKASGLGLAISESKTIYPFGAALRFKVAKGVELSTAFSTESGNTSFTFGGGFEVSKDFYLVAGYTSSDATKGTDLGLRFNF